MEPSTGNRELTAAEVDVVEGGKLEQKTENKNESGKGFGPADFLKW